MYCYMIKAKKTRILASIEIRFIYILGKAKAFAHHLFIRPSQGISTFPCGLHISYKFHATLFRSELVIHLLMTVSLFFPNLKRFQTRLKRLSVNDREFYFRSPSQNFRNSIKDYYPFLKSEEGFSSKTNKGYYHLSKEGLYPLNEGGFCP